ncbi:MAG: molecular chaperone HtpG, partial [Flavobacteriales bacterium]
SKWDDIGVFIHYGMLTDDKFYEKAEKFSLLKTTNGGYFNLEDFKEKIKETQKDKKGDTIVLYANNHEEQFTAIQAASERGWEVVLLDGPLASHYISKLEQKHSGLRFKRVDADVMDKLIEKEDNTASALSDDQKKGITTALEKIIDTKKYHVEFANLSPNEAPFVVTQNEFMRRMKEQSAMGGGGFYGTLPDSYNLVANANHSLFGSIVTDSEGQTVLNESKVKQAIDLALLSKGLLKGEELANFVKRSLESI